MGIGITAVGGYVPERVMPNAEFEALLETNDEWIVARTGIRERRIAAPNETASSMGVLAVRDLLERSPKALEGVDLIVCATSTADDTAAAGIVASVVMSSKARSSNSASRTAVRSGISRNGNENGSTTINSALIRRDRRSGPRSATTAACRRWPPCGRSPALRAPRWRGAR